MAETINLGWLKDKNGDKFAPKTLTSQVQTVDGTLIEDKIRSDIATLKDEVTELLSGKANTSHNHDDVYYTEAEIDTKLDILSSDKKDKDIIVTYVNGSHSQVTHTSQEVYEAVNNGCTVKFQKDAELLDLLESTRDFATFYIVYINMSGKLQQKVVAISGNGIILEQDDTYDYATTSALAAKQNTITGTEGQVVQINASGKAAAADLNLITVDDIDTICGGAIEYAEEVMF